MNKHEVHYRSTRTKQPSLFTDLHKSQVLLHTLYHKRTTDAVSLKPTKQTVIHCYILSTSIVQVTCKVSLSALPQKNCLTRETEGEGKVPTKKLL